jgi:HPt (histidine-containing phosphotransfer) domain-containing protein
VAFERDIAEVVSPPLVPADQPIDLAHLSRMTLGDHNLEREVLTLFGRQAELLLPRIRAGTPAVIGAAAHTLKGSARGIGASRVASAAASVEAATPAEVAAAVDALEAALAETRAAIADLLQAQQRAES